MEGTSTTASTEPVKTPGKIVSAGAATQGTPAFKQPAISDTNDAVVEDKTKNTDANAGAAPAAANAGTNGANGVAPTKDDLPELSEEQLKKLFAAKGIEGFDGNFDTLKQKIEKADKPADVELTEEEKKAAAKAFDERMLGHYLKHGGKVEDYVALKTIASSDLKELSVKEIRDEMKKEKFDDDEIAVVLQERYYQLNPDELTKNPEEEDSDFEKRKELLKKKAAFGSKKLENHSAPIKNKAAEILAGIKSSVEAEILLEKQEAMFSSKVDEFAKKFPRKLTFELGEVDGKKIDPVTYEVTEAAITEAVTLLKDPAKRQQYFFNSDNSLNLDNVAQVLIRNKFLESALKALYLEGGNRQVEYFEKVFPGRTAKDIGVGGKAGGTGTGQKGKIASFGQPEHVVRQNN